MNCFQIINQIVNVESNCYGFDSIVRIIKEGVFPIIQVIIPIILIVLCTFDLGKTVISSDDKENKKTIKKMFRRIVFAIILFFFITFVNLVFTMIDSITDNPDLVKWSQCWNYPGG